MAGPRLDKMDEPVPHGIVQRVMTGVKYVVTGVGPENWFGPMQPLPPIAQEQAAGRRFDYRVGYNLQILPRAEEAIGFDVLRRFGDSYDLLRLVIETRKDQIARLGWSIKPRQGETVADATIESLERFWRYPDQEHTWDEWLRMLLEDMLVIDAATLYPHLTKGGDLYAFEVVDGSTIKRVLDVTGRTPLPPDPAYQQILHNVPAVDYTHDQLIYRPRNLRSQKNYGYSPVEQILMTVSIALRRQLSQLGWYTDGNLPEMLITVPSAWTAEQIRQFQEYFDSLFQGDVAGRRRGYFIPEGTKPVPTKDVILKDEYDEWLARIVCYAFSVSPQPFVKQMNRATAQSALDEAREEGLFPLMQWVKNLIDYCLHKYLRQPAVEFVWDTKEEQDTLKQAQVLQIYVQSGIMDIDEAREQLGLDPRPEPPPAPEPPPRAGGPTSEGGSPGGGGPTPPLGDPITEGDGQTSKPPTSDLRSLSKAKARGTRLAPIPLRRPAYHQALGSLTDALASFLGALGQRVAAAVRKAADDGSLAKADEIDRASRAIDDADWAVLYDATRDTLRTLHQDTGVRALTQLGLQDDREIVQVVHQDAVDYADERAAELVGKRKVGARLIDRPDSEYAISESTRELLKRQITAALEEGPSPDALAASIQQDYAFSRTRAETIARTELATAHSQGALAGYQSAARAGVRVQKTWILDAEPCVVCQGNEEDGVLDLDESFSSGDDAPPAHPNCECALVPVVYYDE